MLFLSINLVFPFKRICLREPNPIPHSLFIFFIQSFNLSSLIDHDKMGKNQRRKTKSGVGVGVMMDDAKK